MLDEVVNSTVHRCVESEMMESSVSITLYIGLMHKSSYGPCILGNGNLRIVIGHSSRRVTNKNAIHGPYDDLCIRSIVEATSGKHNFHESCISSG